MTYIYITIFIFALIIELSVKCNTSNLLKKFGLGAIMLGAIVRVAIPPTRPEWYFHTIEIGILLMLASELIKSYFSSQNRRKNDKLPIIEIYDGEHIKQ